MDNKKYIISSSAMLDLWSKKTRAMKSHNSHDAVAGFEKFGFQNVLRLKG